MIATLASATLNFGISNSLRQIGNSINDRLSDNPLYKTICDTCVVFDRFAASKLPSDGYLFLKGTVQKTALTSATQICLNVCYILNGKPVNNGILIKAIRTSIIAQIVDQLEIVKKTLDCIDATIINYPDLNKIYNLSILDIPLIRTAVELGTNNIANRMTEDYITGDDAVSSLLVDIAKKVPLESSLISVKLIV